MYIGSDEFNNAIENTQGNAPKIRATLEDGTTLDNIKSIKFYGGSNDSDDISIGTTNMARIDVTAFTDKMLTNNEIFLEQGIELANGVVEYMPIGYFTVQKPSGDIDEVTFTAYDRMQKFEKPYSSSLAYPTTSVLILDELCQISGVELATPIENPIEVAENLKGYTCREVLGYIASIHGYFACIDRYGRLNVCWYNDTPIDKNLKKIWHFEKSQDNFEIAKVEIAKDSETNYVSGDGITTLHNSNPLATQEITDDVFAKLGGFSYSVGEIEMLDDARLDPWDMVSVEYYDGKTYIIPCMTLEHDFKAYSTTVKSVGKSESENEYRFTGPTIQYLNRMATELLVANRVIATKVDAEYVNSVAITTENFDAKVAEIKELIVEEIDGKYANIDLANIDIANINVGKIGELFAKVGLIDRATIVEGHITGFLDAVEVNANKITAGTLIADRILLSGGEEGVLYALNNLGELTSTNVDTLDGYVLTDRTINADKLIANSITANELDVNEIFGNTAVLNKLVSQEIFTNAIETNRLVVGASDKAEEALDASQSTNKASGSPILLTDSADGVLIDFKGYGRSTQDGTPTPDSPIDMDSVADSGYFDGELLQGYYNSSNGTYATNNTSAICSKNSIPCKEGDVIKVIYPTTLSQIRICYYNNGAFSSFITRNNVSEYAFTVPTNVTEFNITIISDTVLSPDTAKKIVVTINDTYALQVKSVDKNLFKGLNGYYNISSNGEFTSSTGWKCTDYIACNPSENYTISFVGNGNAGIWVFYDNNKNMLSSSTSANKQTITIPQNCRYFTQYIHGTNTDIQIEFGPESTEYEPYKETVSYIPLTAPLRSVGEVKDEVSLNKVTRRCVEVVFNGSDDEGWNVNGTYSNTFYTTLINFSKLSKVILCDYYTVITSANTSDYGVSIGTYLNFKNKDISSLAEWKAWLQANPITVIYELAEPITETIEPVDIATYNSVTYITATDNPQMEVEYYRNTPTGIQLSKLETIEQDNSRVLANWASDNDITLIDGAKIYTGSITADKIDVDDLFAEDITATGTIRGAILKSINYDEDTGVGMLLNLNNATIESRGEDFVNIFDSRGHYGRYTLAPEGMIFAEERDYLTGQPNLSITNGQLTLNNVKYNSYGIRYSDVDILNWTTEGIATPKLSTDLIYCNGEMAAKTVTASVIRNSTYDLGNVGNIAVQNKQDIATINSNLTEGLIVDYEYLSYSEVDNNQYGTLVTTTKTLYLTQLDPTNVRRKFSSYQYLCFELLINNNTVRATMLIPRIRFVDQVFTVELTYVDSANTQRWVAVTYNDDTSFYMVGSSNIVQNTRVQITGLKAKIL